MEKTVKVRHGLIVFFGCLITIAILGFLAQIQWGLYGLAFTQILILLFAIIPVFIFKLDIKAVFPMKMPKMRHITGSLLVWLGTYLFVLLVTQVTMYMFPEGFMDLAESMRTFFTNTSLPMTMLIVAVMPAICEEMLHRGFLQYTCTMQKKWQTIVFMGIVFGVFHLDPYRFLPTALLGMALTFAMIETKNILLPVFMHFVNNALAVYSSFIDIETVVLTQDQMLMSVGTFLILSSVSPFLVFWGAKLLGSKDRKVFTKPKTIIATVWCLACILVAGALFSTLDMTMDMTPEPLFITNMSMNVNHESPSHSLPIHVENEGTYRVDLSMQIEQGKLRAVIFDSDERELFDHTANQLTLTGPLEMSPGEYTFYVEFVFDTKTIEGYAEATVQIRIDYPR